MPRSFSRWSLPGAAADQLPGHRTPGDIRPSSAVSEMTEENTSSVGPDAAPPRNPVRWALVHVFAIQELGVLLAGLIIGATFSVLSPEFLTPASAGSILASAVQ